MVPGLSWGNASGGRGLLCLLPVLSLECPSTAVEGYALPLSMKTVSCRFKRKFFVSMAECFIYSLHITPDRAATHQGLLKE